MKNQTIDILGNNDPERKKQMRLSRRSHDFCRVNHTSLIWHSLSVASENGFVPKTAAAFDKKDSDRLICTRDG